MKSNPVIVCFGPRLRRFIVSGLMGCFLWPWIAVASADPAKDWLELMNASDPIKWEHQPSLSEAYGAHDRHAQKLITLAEAFYRNYPTDSRRWRAAVFYIGARPIFASNYPEAPAGMDQLGYFRSLVRDAVALAEWETKARSVAAEVINAKDAPLRYKEAVEYLLVMWELRKMRLKEGPHGEEAMTNLFGQFALLLANYRTETDLEPALTEHTKAFIGAMADLEIGAALTLAVRIANDETMPGGVRQLAAVRHKEIMTQGKPFEMKFTALDGREVDVAKLRGRVVLIDFWATWCGPCEAEMPNLKQVYAAYHDQGFEVIGISLDKPDNAKGLADFCRENGMTWPQFLDGSDGRTSLAAKHGITGIPAMFLLDKEGKVVTRNARGVQLEPLVKQLLGRP